MIQKKIVGILLIVVMILSSTLIYQNFIQAPPTTLAQGYTSLGLNVTPSGASFKLGVNESKTFTVQATNGSAPFVYTWTLAPSGNFTIQLNGESHDVTNASSITLSGPELSVCYPTATEEYVSLTVSVTDANGYTGSILQPIVVADPYTSPGYKFDASTATADYIIQSDGLGWYRAIEGKTGMVKWSSTNRTQVLVNTLSVCTSGDLVQLDSGVTWDTAVTIPTGVQVSYTDSSGRKVVCTAQYPYGYYATPTDQQLSLSTFNVENMTSFTAFPRELSVVGDELLIATNDTKGYSLTQATDGTVTSIKQIFSKTFSSGYANNMGFAVDTQGNTYTTVDFQLANSNQGILWRSNDSRGTWENVLNMTGYKGDGTATKGGSLLFNSYVFMDNGTQLIGQWALYSGAYIYRSDDFGKAGTWSLWCNLTEVLGFTAQYLTDYTVMRHIHQMCWVPETNTLIVSTGDGAHAVWSISGGNVNASSSWTCVNSQNGYTTRVRVGDSILFFSDGWCPILKYNITTNTWRNVALPVIRNYSSTNLAHTVAYDKENGVLYVSVECSPFGATTPAIQSIIASTDGGNTWLWFYKQKATADITSQSLSMVSFGDYIYMASKEYGLQRFHKLTAAQVNYLAKGQDTTTTTIYQNGGLSLSNKALTDATVTISSATVTNQMSAKNPSFEETWGSNPPSWGGFYPASWTGTYNKTDGGAGGSYDGTHSYKCGLTGHGTSTSVAGFGLTTGATTISLPAGKYVFGAYMNATASFPLVKSAVSIIAGGTTIAIQTQMLLNNTVNTWTKLECSFVLTQTTDITPYLYPIYSGAENTVDCYITFDAVYLYAYASDEVPNLPYTTTSTSTSSSGSIVIGNQLYSWTSLPTTVTLPAPKYVTGYLPIRLISGTIATVTISGTPTPLSTYPIRG